VADETREWPSTKECALADGDQPADPIRDSGLRAAAKVRMYGCNRNLSAASREEKPGKVGGVHVPSLRIAPADIRPSALRDFRHPRLLLIEHRECRCLNASGVRYHIIYSKNEAVLGDFTADLSYLFARLF
jgi:hypothetical protein